MSDTISRQAAIDALKGLPTWWADEGGYYGGAQPPMVALLDPEDAVSAIENLPSAQPVRHGKWLPKHHYIAGYEFVSGHICSECGNDALNAEGDDFLTDYCPNCGAKMDGEVEGKSKK